MLKLLKKIVVIVLAFGVFVGTLFFENGLSSSTALALKGRASLVVGAGDSVKLTHVGQEQTLQADQGPQELQLFPGDLIDTGNANLTQLHFADFGVIRLAPATVVGFMLNNVQNDGFALQLFHGRAWVNNLFASVPFNLLAGGAVLIPDHASFDVSFDQTKTVVNVARHNVLVGLVPLNFTFDAIHLYADQTFINSYLVAQGNQTTVFSDTIRNNTVTLRQLLYSKLIKEFQYGLFDSEQFKNDPWVAQNLQADADFMQQIATTQSDLMRKHGLHVADFNGVAYQLQQATAGLANTFTFSVDKIMTRALNDLFDHLRDSEYLIVFGRSAEAKDRLDYFKNTAQTLLSGATETFKTAFLDRLRKEYQALVFVMPTDPLFEAKTVVSDLLLVNLGKSDQELREKFLLVRDAMNNVYDLADSNVQLARQSLEQYYKYFTDLVSQGKNRLIKVKDLIGAENQIMDNIFRQYPQFYHDPYFAMKSQLEQEWLSLISDGNDRNEEKQTIIANKIDFLKQLEQYFLADKITVDDARQIVFRLFRETDDLQLPTDAQVAVGDLFAQRLKDFGVFYRYLSSPEYVTTTLHGSTHQEQFQQFLQAQQEQVSIDEVRREILGQQGGTQVTVQEILDRSQKDFTDVGVTDVDFGDLADLRQKLLAVQSASLNDTVFQAQYDWDQKLISQVTVNGEVVARDPIKLANLKFILQSQNNPVIQKQTQQVSTTQQTTLTKTEQVAKILLIQKLKSNDILTTADQIKIVNLDQGQFVIESATVGSNKSIVLTFSLDGDNIVSNLIIVTPAGNIEPTTLLKLSDLAGQAKSIYAQSKAKP